MQPSPAARRFAFWLRLDRTRKALDTMNPSRRVMVAATWGLTRTARSVAAVGSQRRERDVVAAPVVDRPQADGVARVQVAVGSGPHGCGATPRPADGGRSGCSMRSVRPGSGTALRRGDRRDEKRPVEDGPERPRRRRDYGDLSVGEAVRFVVVAVRPDVASCSAGCDAWVARSPRATGCRECDPTYERDRQDGGRQGHHELPHQTPPTETCAGASASAISCSEPRRRRSASPYSRC